MRWINAQVLDKLYGHIEFVSAEADEKVNIINTAFTINESSQAIVEIKEVKLFYNDKRWTIDKQNSNPTLVVGSTSDFAFSNLNFMTETSFITADASQKGNDAFAVDVKFSNVNLDLIFHNTKMFKKYLNNNL